MSAVIAVIAAGAWMRAGRWAVVLLAFGLAAARGSAVLDNTYHFDERFSLANVEAFLAGSLRPANAFYPSLSYLPQGLVLAASEGLHRLTGIGALSVYDASAADGFSRTAYLLCRLLAALYAALGVLLLERVARRLFDPMVALVAALLLAVTPAIIVTGSVFKPDILVMTLTVLAFDWAEAALRAPRARRFLRAGAGVGLAVAAKYTGVGAALPLVVGGLAGARRDRRLWLWLPLAAAAALATFVALNPHLDVIFEYLGRVLGIYERKGAAAGGSRLEVIAAEIDYLVRHHGVAITLLAAAGAAGLAARLRRGRAPDERRAALLVLGFVLGYSALYAAATTLFKGQNYLPVLPFTSLLAAWAAVAGGRAAARRYPALTRPAGWPRRALVAGALVLALGLAARQAIFVYRQVLPSSYDAAWSYVASQLGDLGLRQVAYESEIKERDRLVDGASAGVAVRSELTAERAGDWQLSDAELFYRDRARQPGSFAAERLGRVGWDEVRSFRGQLFARHGGEVVVLLHPWRPDPALAGLPGAARPRSDRRAARRGAAGRRGGVRAAHAARRARRRGHPARAGRAATDGVQRRPSAGEEAPAHPPHGARSIGASGAHPQPPPARGGRVRAAALSLPARRRRDGGQDGAGLRIRARSRASAGR